MIRSIGSVTAAAALLIAATGAEAQQGQQQHQQGKQQAAQQGQQQQQAQQQRKGVVSASGKIVDMRQIRTKSGDQHRLIKLETNGGNHVVVDLGATTGAQTNLQKGDLVFITGRAGRINDLPIIFARYVGEMQQVGQAGEAQLQAAAEARGESSAGSGQASMGSGKSSSGSSR